MSNAGERASRCGHARLDELLHPDFDEVGRSGRTYDRTTVLAFLASQGTPAAEAW